eukprot:GHVS01000492.1.p1 GENE.GHVS01000492.1~~GHVS01000492.1.p1  ORF type:complete len:209 (-),score=57.25 GHVS01000492.1:250-876(-)
MSSPRRHHHHPPPRVVQDVLHDSSLLMVPPSGYKFIPQTEVVCGRAGCFECFDIYCERCDSKDRRIVELEMRNNDLTKYITKMQGMLLGTRGAGGGQQMVGGGEGEPSMSAGGGANPLAGYAGNAAAAASRGGGGVGRGGSSLVGTGGKGRGAGGGQLGYIQSPVLYDPSMDLSYVALTTFEPVQRSSTQAKGSSRQTPHHSSSGPTT